MSLGGKNSKLDFNGAGFVERGESGYNEWNVCVDSNEIFTDRCLYILFHNVLGTWKMLPWQRFYKQDGIAQKMNHDFPSKTKKQMLSY